jgi:hypothetical protein
MHYTLLVALGAHLYLVPVLLEPAGGVMVLIPMRETP